MKAAHASLLTILGIAVLGAFGASFGSAWTISPPEVSRSLAWTAAILVVLAIVAGFALFAAADMDIEEKAEQRYKDKWDDLGRPRQRTRY